MQNMKWASTKGGSYASTSVMVIASLSYIPLFTGSTIYFAGWISGSIYAGINYYLSAYKNGVDISGWGYFKFSGYDAGQSGYNLGSQETSMVTSFANPASGTAIALSVNISAYHAPYQFNNGNSGLVVWEVVG